MPTQTEQHTALTKAILMGLAWRRINAWRNQAIPVPRRVDGVLVGLRRADPMLRGIPDIFAILPGGRLWGIEVKTGSATLEPEQRDWRDRLLAAGSEWTLARSWDDVEEVLKFNCI